MANIIPEKMINFDVYINGSEQSGVADGSFPSIEFMTSEVKGAGLAGTVDSPVLGHFGSITASLKWRVTPKNFYDLAVPGIHTIDFYAGLQSLDAGLGVLKTQSLHIYVKAFTKKYDLGNLVVGDSQEAETEHEIIYMKVYLDGAERVEIDKYNYIYKVNGKDYLAELRRALGRM